MVAGIHTIKNGLQNVGFNDGRVLWQKDKISSIIDKIDRVVNRKNLKTYKIDFILAQKI